jgi:exosortase A
MLMEHQPGAIDAATVRPQSTRRGALLLVVLALLAPFALYLATARSIVDIWNSSDTFAHGYVILPISLWLVWRRRDNFKTFPPTPYWPALLLLAGAGAAWLAAQLGQVQVVQQYAFVAMLPIMALALFGRRLAGSLAFPLMFVLFAVPFGEIFVAPLIEFTADCTVWLVQLTGIPVLRSGTRFELPTGSWSVVEACSGVRYLISSVTLGCLYAYLTYRSTARRLMFAALSVVVPVIANGLRAYMIVMIGHTSGMKLATGVDHIIYGWLFFGLVMFVMFWIGSYWREDTEAPAPETVRAPAAAAAPADAGRRSLAPVCAAVLALAALWPALASYLDHANQRAAPVQLAPVVGWPAAPAFASWKPAYLEPDVRWQATFRRDGGAAPVGATILYYRNQNGAKSLISSLNRLAGYKDSWHEIAADSRAEHIAGQPLSVRESALQGPEGSLLVWHWMWVGGHATTSGSVGKLWQARSKLLMNGDDGAAIMLSAPYDGNPENARAALRSFLDAQGAALQAGLAAAAR